MRSYNHIEWCNQNFIFLKQLGDSQFQRGRGKKKEKFKGKGKKKGLWFELHIWTSYETYITKSKTLEN